MDIRISCRLLGLTYSDSEHRSSHRSAFLYNELERCLGRIDNKTALQQLLTLFEDDAELLSWYNHYLLPSQPRPPPQANSQEDRAEVYGIFLSRVSPRNRSRKAKKEDRREAIHRGTLLDTEDEDILSIMEYVSTVKAHFGDRSEHYHRFLRLLAPELTDTFDVNVSLQYSQHASEWYDMLLYWGALQTFFKPFTATVDSVTMIATLTPS